VSFRTCPILTLRRSHIIAFALSSIVMLSGSGRQHVSQSGETVGGLKTFSLTVVVAQRDSRCISLCHVEMTEAKDNQKLRRVMASVSLCFASRSSLYERYAVHRRNRNQPNDYWRLPHLTTHRSARCARLRKSSRKQLYG